MDYVLTLAVPIIGILLLIASLSKSEYMNFLGKDVTFLMRGVAALIVVMVHIPELYHNKIQDMIGSFAFICVMFFFFLSGYGMMLGAKRGKPAWKFWNNRLVALLIPMTVVNLVGICFCYLGHKPITFLALLHIDRYVVQLLAFCMIYYVCANLISDYMKLAWTIATLVFAISVLLYIVDYGWKVPFIGAAIGCIAAAYINRIELMSKCAWGGIFLMFLFILLGIVYIRVKSVFFIGDFIIRATLGICGLACMFYMTRYIQVHPKRGALGAMLSNISYEIYLIHHIVIVYLLTFKMQSSGLYIIYTYVITILLSVIVHQICKPIVLKLRR